MVAYKAEIDDPRIDSVRILRPQEIPHYVADGLFDLGITGRDWVEETGRSTSSRSASCSTPRPRAIPCGSSWPSPATRRRTRSATCPTACGWRPSTPSSPAASSPPRASTAEIRLLARRHRGQDPRHRRRHRRHHRDRAGAAGRRPAHHRHDPHVAHRAGGQPRRATPIPPSATPCTSCARSCRACSRPGAGCWSSSTARPRCSTRVIAVLPCHEVPDGQRAVRRRPATPSRPWCPRTRSTR